MRILVLLALLSIHCARGNDRRLEAYGSIEARTMELASKVGGRVLEVLVDEGDRVRRAQVLVRFDARELEAQKAQAQAALEAAEAREDLLVEGARSEDIRAARQSLRAAEEREQLARRNLVRAEQLAQKNFVPRQALDDARSERVIAGTNLRASQANLERLLTGSRKQELREAAAMRAQAQASLELAEVRLEERDLLAPEDGVILHREVEPGEVARAGASLLTLGELDRPYIDVYVPEPRVAEARLGTRAEVVVDALPGRTFEGTVTRVGTEAEFTPKNVQTADQRARLVFRIRVSIADPERLLHPGMPGRAIFERAQQKPREQQPAARRPTGR